MSTWLNPDFAATRRPAPRLDPRMDLRLRCMDMVLATLALTLLALPMALALLLARPQSRRQLGRHNRPYARWQLQLTGGLAGRVLGRIGLRDWPVLFNILMGDMAWVGHAPIDADSRHDHHPLLAGARPGLVSIWTLRQRTAVDFGSQHDADLEYLALRGLRHDLGLLMRTLLLLCLPHARAPGPQRIALGDVQFDNLDMTQAVACIGSMLDGHATQQVSFVNAACVNIAAHDRGYRRLLARAALVLPDGIGIKIAAGMLGLGLKQNVNGTDLFPRLCAMLESRGASLFLLGGHPGVVERVQEVIRAQWPQLRVVGARDGYFGLAQEGQVAAQVRSSGADVLLVARGVPMQDIFIDRQLHQLGVKVAIGVGGLFDFVSGRIDRAPAWMRDTGLEWIYRLRQEPARMWRRYLLGNFTFLARILLQRVGLRQPANDALPAPAGAAHGQKVEGLRTVLFATTSVASDIPVTGDFPAALLPFGCSTFLEHTLDQLAGVGVRDLDLVVSARPEELRRLLGQGERWGMRLHWHLAKDGATPYGILRALDLEPTQRVLLGHADRWIADEAMAELFERDLVLAQTSAQQGLDWAGWGCATAAQLQAVSPHGDEAALGTLLCSSTTQLKLLHASQYIGVRSARQLLQAQQWALGGEALQGVPATWLRTAWGAHSPDAVVDADAVLQGPVLIGAGCVVAAGANIGPGTVLTRDVVVSGGCSISRSLVLPQTFVGDGLELEEAVVNGPIVQHLRWDVRTELAPSDALLLDLRAPPSLRPTLSARATAALACGLCLPWLAVDTALRHVRGLPLRWRAQEVALGSHTGRTRLQLQTLRCARPTERGLGRLLAHYGAWLDVVAGHRCWFGARPRSLSQWYALNRDWQRLLVNTPVGCLHAPAWSDGHGSALEAGAAADVFFAVSQSALQRVKILLTALPSGG